MDSSASNAFLPPDESRGSAILVISWLSVAVAIFFVACRLYTRLRITRNAALDDVLVAASVVLFIIPVALTNVSVSHGLGRHVVYLQPDQVSYILYLSAILQPIGIFSYVVPKLAVVMLIIKLMGPKKHGVWFLYSIFTILAISSALAAMFLFVQCDPPSHFWNPMEHAKCWSPNVLMYTTVFSGSWSAFVDLSLAIFPITVFWNLKIKRSRKICISTLMGFGVFAMACAIIKTTYLPQDENPDLTWNIFGLQIWTFIETAVVIVCACIPTLPQLVLLLLRKDQNPTYYQPSRQSRAIPPNFDYDKIFDDPSRRDEVEMHQISDGSSVPRTVNAHAQWESV